jgi:hypothetical protein
MSSNPASPSSGGQSKNKLIRRNLDHLSQDEKRNTRKIKNREEAQRSRDRQKVKMDLLEAKVARMSEERIMFEREIEHLRNRDQFWSKRTMN